MQPGRSFKIVLLTLLASRSLPLLACENPISFDIEALPVDRALLRFAQQANVSALFPSGVLGSMQANRVMGEYCIEDALAALLEGVNVDATLDETGQLVVGLADGQETSASADAQTERAAAAALAAEPQGKINRLINVLGAILTGGGEEVARRRSETVLPEEITISGSRIRQLTGMTAPTPVTTVSSIELASFDPGSTVAEQLDALPQFFSTQTAQRGGTTFADAGGSYLNLRGMGTNRTLVLLNGSRVIPSDAFGNVNVDNFPTALLDHVDIVTGGASAAYGADAISGVVNFILNREFTGLKASLSTGVTQRGDGKNWKFSVAGGRKFGRLHFTGSAEARFIDQIDADQNRLDNWLNWGHVRNPEWSPADPPGTQPRVITVPAVFPTSYSPQGLITTPDFKYNAYTFTDDGKSVRPYEFGSMASFSGSGATRTQSGGQEYATWRASTSGGPESNEVVQRSMFTSLKYDLAEGVEVYGQALVARTESNAYGRRGQPALDSIWSATIYAENPYLPEQVRQAMLDEGRESITVSKRGTLYGPGLTNYAANRHDRNINQLASLSAGFNAEIHGSWALNGSYQHGRSKVSSSALNILRLDNFFMALDTVPHPVTGAPVCNISVINPTPEQLKDAVRGQLVASPLSLLGVEVNSPIGPMNFSDCVPINVFGLGNVSPEASAWVEDAEKKNLRTLDQDFYELLLTGELHEGWGAGPLTLASGISYRREKFAQFNLPLWGERGLRNAPELGIRGIPGGFTGPGNRSLHQFTAIGVGSGGFDVSEWFGELNVPLFDLRSGQALGSSFAVRSSRYSSHGPILSWKAGLDFQLIPDLRWRFTRSRDVREPNFSEKFVSGVGGATLFDPVFNETYVITSISGPNPDLASELANTITTGFVWQPTKVRWLEGVQFAIDWYDIDLSSAVGRLGPQRLTNDCFQNALDENCELVQRNPITDRVDRVIDRFFNVGGAKTSGVDLEFHYFREPDLMPLLYEAFNLKAYIGYLQENSTTTALGIKVDSIATRDRPQYTANITAGYNIGAYGISVQQRYYDSTLFNTDWVEGTDVDDNTIASQSLTNLVFSYEYKRSNDSLWNINFYVTNLFDRAPPVIPGQVLANGHDQYGRRYQLSLTATF